MLLSFKYKIIPIKLSEMRMRFFIVVLLFSGFTKEIHAAVVDTVMVYSHAMKKDVPCVVIRPQESNSVNKKYPVVYWLHGYSGNYRWWVKGFESIKESVDQYGIIAVCPDGGYSSWYFDSPLDTSFRYETFVSKELVSFIDEHYPTLVNRIYRGITGASMGGHGAFYLALRHKDLFGAVNSMGGGLDLRPFPDNWEIKKRIGPKDAYPENWDRYTVVNLLDSLKSGEMKIAFDCGSSDFFIGVNRAVNAKLIAKNIDHDYAERPGAHTGDYWGNSIYYHFLFFSRYFKTHK